jgi:hypothetical protein
MQNTMQNLDLETLKKQCSPLLGKARTAILIPETKKTRREAGFFVQLGWQEKKPTDSHLDSANRSSLACLNQEVVRERFISAYSLTAES